MGRHPFFIEFLFLPSDILSISLCEQRTPNKVDDGGPTYFFLSEI